MNCDVCRDLIDAMLDGEIDDRTSRSASAHLAECAACAAERSARLRERRFYARHRPAAEASPAAWRAVRDRIRPVRPRSPRRSWREVRVYALAAALAAVTLAAIVVRVRTAPDDPSAPNPDWTRLGSGRPDSILRSGDWTRTGAIGTATLASAIGTVQVAPDTRLRLVEARSEHTRFLLASGRIEPILRAPAGVFDVVTPSGVVEDLGCAFTLSVDASGDASLSVRLGDVGMRLGDRSAYVPQGATCEARAGIGPGTPSYAGTSATMRAALADLDFGAGRSARHRTARAASLRAVLREATRGDLVALWNLLPRFEESDRAAIYDRMIELHAPPQGVGRADVIRLDPIALDRWKPYL